VAKGARRPKSAFRGKIDLFYTADFSFTRSRRSDLHTLTEVVLRDTHAGLRQDLRALQQAAYAAALIEQTTEAETPVLEIHELLAGFLQVVASKPVQGRTVMAFELKLLHFLGLDPDLGEASLSPAARTLAGEMTQGGWDRLAELKATAGEAGEIRRFLHGFLIYHLGRVLPGRTRALLSPSPGDLPPAGTDQGK
jgi:DNA repair protein RecO